MAFRDDRTAGHPLIAKKDPSGLIASPQHCGLAGGEYFPFIYGPELPADQRMDDALSLCIDQPPLDEDIDIVGAPRVDVVLSSDRPQANICVRLCDVHPDGASELISYGLLNLTHRNSHEFPEALPVGEFVTATVGLDQCAYRVPAGHRLRVAISNAYWPVIWPSPQAGQLTLSQATLSLPVRPSARGDEVSFEPPEAAAPWAIETVRPDNSERNIVIDEKTGVVTVTVFNDFGAQRDLAHDLVSGSVTTEKWTIHPDDPLSARGEIAWTQTLSRQEWSVRTETLGTMWSDAEAFHLTARIRAFEGPRVVFEHEFADNVPRDHL